MKQVGNKAEKTVYARFALAALLLQPAACASLPDLDEIGRNDTREQGQYLIAGQHGLLSPQRSEEIFAQACAGRQDRLA